MVIGKIKKILLILEQNNMEINKNNYNKFVKCGTLRYDLAIERYPELFNSLQNNK